MTHYTADGVPITDGMTVWDNDLHRVTVRLSGAWVENGELWFDTSDGLSSATRVATRHPVTREIA